MLLVDDFDDDEPDAAHDAGGHQDKHARHVLEAQRGRRLVVGVALVVHALQDPLVVQLLHVAALVELQDGQRDAVRPRRVLLEADAVAGAPEQLARRHQLAVLRRLVLQSGAVPDERLQLPERRRGSNSVARKGSASARDSRGLRPQADAGLESGAGPPRGGACTGGGNAGYLALGGFVGKLF